MAIVHYKWKLIVGFLLFTICANAQLTTQGGIPAIQLVQNNWLGQGVTLVDASFSGAPGAIGSFNAVNTNLGLDQGIIFTTGTISDNGNGPHGPNNREDAGIDTGYPGTTLLASQTGPDTYDAAAIDIDFIPLGDEIEFEYVFASEEWPTYFSSGYNDAFGIFLSGPGINGMVNIATLPGGGPVSIPNINNGQTNTGPCQNCQYYVANGDGSIGPYNGSSYYLQYNGFTTPLTARAQVQCGQQYHLKIIVVDAVSTSHDSGLFLKANSLTSEVPVMIDVELENDHNNDGVTLAENCETAYFNIARLDSTLPLNIQVSSIGQATDGVDFTSPPSTISLAAGQGSTQFSIDALGDFVTEGLESLILEFEIPGLCSTTDIYSVELNIEDVDSMTSYVTDQAVHCAGDEATLSAYASGGIGPYSYSWSTGQSTQFIDQAPTQTTTYYVEIQDVCIDNPHLDSAQIIVPIYDAIQFVYTTDTTVFCPNTPVVLNTQPIGGDGNYSYIWSHNGSIIGPNSSVQVSPLQSTDYLIQVIDGCLAMGSDTATVLVETPVLQLISIHPDPICPYDSTQIAVEATSGTGNYFYTWSHSPNDTAVLWVNPPANNQYYVGVEDDCGTYTVEEMVNVIVSQPTANFQFEEEALEAGLPVDFQNLSQNSVAWNWNFNDLDSSVEQFPTFTFNVEGDYQIELIAIDTLGCNDTTHRNLRIAPEFHVCVPNAFTPDGDEYNNVFKPEVIGVQPGGYHLQVYNRWGERIFESFDPSVGWDGTYIGRILSPDIFIWRLRARNKLGIWHEYKGHVSLVK